MKRKIFIAIIVITLVFPVFFAFRSQAIIHWLTGNDYRIKTSSAQPGSAALANTSQLLSLDFIEPDLSRMSFILNLEGQHLFGGKPFSVEFFPKGVIITDANDLVGVLNDAGEVIIPFEYDRIRYSDDTLMATRANQPTIYYRSDGLPLFKTSQPIQLPFSEGLAYLSNGVHDTQGQLIFTPEAPILLGFKQGRAAASTGQQVLVYAADGAELARLDYPEVFDWNEDLVLVGDADAHYLVDYKGELKLTLTLDREEQFRVRSPEGADFGERQYDQIELLDDQRILLRHQLNYYYYSLSGEPILDPEIGLLEPFKDGYSLSASGSHVLVYHESGKLVQRIPGQYLPGSFTEGCFVVTRPGPDEAERQYLYSAVEGQLSYRPLQEITPRHLGVSLVFQADRGVGFIRNEPATELVFVPSKLWQGMLYAFPTGLIVLLGLYFFTKRYQL